MKISDIITQQIMKLLDESEMNTAEIQRNELASKIGCVPSQINYVISSRFIPEHGYIVESRRGGGGYIRITRVQVNKQTAIMHIVNTIGDSLSDTTARVLLENCCHSGLISEEFCMLIYSAMSSNVMKHIPVDLRDEIRAVIMKQMLISLI